MPDRLVDTWVPLGVADEDREPRREPHGDHLVQEQPLPSVGEQDHDSSSTSDQMIKRS